MSNAMGNVRGQRRALRAVRGAWCTALAVLTLAAGCGDDSARLVEQVLDEREQPGGAAEPEAAEAEEAAEPEEAEAEAEAATAEALTLAEGELSALALGGGTVYVVDQAAAVIARLPVGGGPLEPISPALELLPQRLVADESSVYAALFLRPGHTELWRLPATGGAFDAAHDGVLLGEVPSVAALDVNASSVVSLEARPTPSSVTRGIVSLPKVAGGVVPTATVDLLFSDAFALDDQAAFVVRGGDGVSDLARVDLASGEVSSLVAAEPDESLRDVAVASGVAYFASTTRVGRTPEVGGAAGAGTLSATPAYGLVVAADSVYFFEASGAGCAGGSELYRVAVTGGTAEHLASEPAPGCVTDLVGDAGGIYWLTKDGSRLRGLPLR